jgi:hypothetical protein
MKMALGKGNPKMVMARSLCHHASPAQSIIANIIDGDVECKRSKVLE